MAMRRIISALTVLSLSAWRGCAAAGKFDLSRSDNIALYWGQSNSPLSDVCKNDDVNIIPISFLTNADGQGTINLAGNCDGPAFPGTGLLDCHQFEQDIKDCQSAGKIVVMSLGGAGGSISFSSDDEAKAFGESFYKNFLGGNSSTRPFGDAILDGIDLDLESPGTHRATFVNHTLDYAKQQGDNRKYYITGAPQCPCEDANMKDVMASAPFDAVFVQFYNNPPCQLTQDVNMKTFNFGQWFGWFKGVATLNKDTKIFVGAPGDPSAAGSGYADSAALAKYIDAIRKNSTAPMFGGMMFWDAPSAMNNKQDPGFLHNVKKALTAGGAGSPSGGSSGTVPSATSGSASASGPASSATDASSAADGSATGTTGAASATGDSTTIAATGTASDPTSTAVDGSSDTGGSAIPTSGTSDGPIATTSGTDASQTTSQMSTPTGGSGDDGDDSDDSDCDDGDGDEDGDESSQAAGPTATPTASSGAPVTCTPPPSDCSGVPDWQKSQQYQKCASVRYQGQLYEAASWVTSNEPGTIDVWKLIGSCPGSSAGSSPDSSTPSSTGSFMSSSTDSSTLSSFASATDSSTTSLVSPSGSSSALSTDLSTASATGSSVGSTATSGSQSTVSSSQPERRLFGARARHAE